MNDVASFTPLFTLARHAIEQAFLPFGTPAVPAPVSSADTALPVARLNLTLRRHGVLRASMSGEGGTLAAQLLHATARALADRRFGAPIVHAEAGDLSLELWIQTSAEPLPLPVRTAPDSLRLGLDGLDLALGTHSAYYKPSVAITSGFRSTPEMLSALCRKAGLSASSWQDPACEVYRTRWLHLTEAAGVVRELRFLRSASRCASSIADIRQWLDDGARYFLANQQADGCFCYLYQPLAGTASSSLPNTVRVSGCLYSLVHSLPWLSPDVRSLAATAAEKALRNITNRLAPWRAHSLAVPEFGKDPGPHKLGSTALLAVALLAPRTTIPDTLAPLLETLKRAQLPEGSFLCRLPLDPSQPAPDAGTSVDYYPGQALLAFSLLAERGDCDALLRCENAFTWCRDHFHNNRNTAFLGWQVDVWSRIARMTGNADHAAFVFDQLDWLLPFQITDPAREAERGAFTQLPGKTPSCAAFVYLEALVRGCALAREVGDTARLKAYSVAIHLGLAFCARLWIASDQTAFLRDPARALGGVSVSLTDLTVRSDNVQHAMTLGIALLENDWLFKENFAPGSLPIIPS